MIIKAGEKERSVAVPDSVDMSDVEGGDFILKSPGVKCTGSDKPDSPNRYVQVSVNKAVLSESLIVHHVSKCSSAHCQPEWRGQP